MSHPEATAAAALHVRNLLAAMAEDPIEPPRRSAMRFAVKVFKRTLTATPVPVQFQEIEKLLAEVTETMRAYEAVSDQAATMSRDVFEHILRIGVPAESLELLAEAYRVSLSDVASWIDASPKTLRRWRADLKPLPPMASDVALRYGRVFEQAKEAFGSEAAAQVWLTSAQPALANRVPLEMLKSELDAREVERLLDLIDWGEYI
jgi:putative toxin-antitoxin system antitoxin component (TIGR02293 family)